MTREFQAPHELCGTLVQTELPADYPVAEGVGLYCPACNVGFWHVPLAETAHVVAPEFFPPRAAEVIAVAETVIEEPAAPAAREPTSPATPAATRDERRAEAERVAAEARRRSLRRLELLVGAVALGAAVWAVAWLATGNDNVVAPAPAPAIATPTAAPTATPTATPEAGLTPVDIRGHTMTLAEPAGWEPRFNSVGDLTLTAPLSAGSVTVSARDRRGRSLTRLGRDARRSLRSALPGHRISGPIAVPLNGRSAMRVTARRGADAREITVLSAGEERFLVVLDLRSDAPRDVRIAGRTTADSVTIG